MHLVPARTDHSITAIYRSGIKHLQSHKCVPCAFEAENKTNISSLLSYWKFLQQSTLKRGPGLTKINGDNQLNRINSAKYHINRWNNSGPLDNAKILLSSGIPWWHRLRWRASTVVLSTSPSHTPTLWPQFRLWSVPFASQFHLCCLCSAKPTDTETGRFKYMKEERQVK